MTTSREIFNKAVAELTEKRRRRNLKPDEEISYLQSKLSKKPTTPNQALEHAVYLFVYQDHFKDIIANKQNLLSAAKLSMTAALTILEIEDLHFDLTSKDVLEIYAEHCNRREFVDYVCSDKFPSSAFIMTFRIEDVKKRHFIEEESVARRHKEEDALYEKLLKNKNFETIIEYQLKKYENPLAFSETETEKKESKPQDNPMTSLEAANTILKKEPKDEKEATRYAEIAIHWEKNSEVKINKDYLYASACKSTEAAKYLFKSTLSNYIPFKARFDIYSKREGCLDFRAFVQTNPNIRKRWTLPVIKQEAKDQSITQQINTNRFLHATYRAQEKLFFTANKSALPVRKQRNVEKLKQGKHDPFEILEIDGDPTIANIKAGYRKFAIFYHPDKKPEDPTKFDAIRDLNSLANVDADQTEAAQKAIDELARHFKARKKS